MNKNFHKWMTLSFILYIGGFFILQMIGEEKTYSALENRNLASMPSLTKDSFMSGKFGEDFEKYIADQFPARDRFIALKANSELLLQKTDNNGVYIGDDGYFLQMFEAPDALQMEKNIAYMNTFGQDLNLYFMLVPTATKIHEDKLPNFATPYDEKQFIDTFRSGLNENIGFVDVYDKLKAHENEYIFYKTDHHWTTLGAYYGYVAFCETYGIEPMALDSFSRIPSTEPFYGSLFSKGNFTFATADTLELFEPSNPVSLQVTNIGTGETTDTLYDMDFLEEKDQYSVFLGGNHPVVEIKTDVANGKKIAVLKDSYANAMLPFMTQHFEEIHVLDLRFLNMNIADYVRSKGIEDVLMLYNAQNFATVNQFSLLGQ